MFLITKSNFINLDRVVNISKVTISSKVYGINVVTTSGEFLILKCYSQVALGLLYGLFSDAIASCLKNANSCCRLDDLVTYEMLEKEAIKFGYNDVRELHYEIY